MPPFKYLSLFWAKVFLIGLKESEFLWSPDNLKSPFTFTSKKSIDVNLMTLIGVAGLRSSPAQFGRPLFFGLSKLLAL